MWLGFWMNWWKGGKRRKNPGPRIPQCGHLQVQAGRRTDRLKQVGSQVTQ